MRRLIVFAALLVLAAVVVAFWHWHRARFEITVIPHVAPAAAQCRSIADAHGLAASSVAGVCQAAVGLPWFHASVTNTGHSAAYAYCWAHGYDRPGATVLRVAFSPGTFGTPGLPRLAPGQTLAGDWFFAVAPTGPVDHYTAGCWATDRPGPE